MKEHNPYLSVIKFPAYVSLSLILFIAVYVLFLVGALKQTVVSTPQSVMLGVTLIILLLLVATWSITLMSTHIRLRVKWLQKLSKWMMLHFYYSLAKGLAIITFTDKCDLYESFLNFNNETVLTDQHDVRNSNILVLLPHCLQKDSCTIRIATDIVRCEECGGCDISRIKKLVDEQNVDAAVASGGSLARKLIKDKNPDVIVAVACHRDLVEGLRDAWMYPVYAVLNERPQGPCHETTVSIPSIEFAIKRFK